MIKRLKRTIVDFFLLILAMLVIIFLWANTILTVVFLFFISIAMLIKTNKTDIMFFIIIGLGATLVESLTISSGAWVYSAQHIGIVPIWIPLYWGIGGTVMKDIYFLLKEIIE
jgi:hypothetical protein